MYERIHLSPAGRIRLEQELARQVDAYERLCEERTRAHELSGDGWHDNPYFNKLQQDEARKSQDIAALRQQLASAEQHEIRDGHRSVARVALGSLVLLREETRDGTVTERVWEIVCWGETDLAAGRVAYNAPLIRPVMGAEPGDILDVPGPPSAREIEVVRLFRGWGEVPQALRPAGAA